MIKNSINSHPVQQSNVVSNAVTFFNSITSGRVSIGGAISELSLFHLERKIKSCYPFGINSIPFHFISWPTSSLYRPLPVSQKFNNILLGHCGQDETHAHTLNPG